MDNSYSVYVYDSECIYCGKKAKATRFERSWACSECGWEKSKPAICVDCLEDNQESGYLMFACPCKNYSCLVCRNVDEHAFDSALRPSTELQVCMINDVEDDSEGTAVCPKSKKKIQKL